MNILIIDGFQSQEQTVRRGANSNTAIATFSMAVDRAYKRDGEPTCDFFRCKAFGKTAEFIEKYGKVGQGWVIEGHLQNETWEKDGIKHYDTVVYIDRISFPKAKKSDQTAPNTDTDGFINADGLDDELPFV